MSSVLQFPGKRPPRLKLGDRTRVVRREMGLSQAAFAAKLAEYLPSVKAKAYGAWEAGINEPENKEDVCVALEKMTGYPRTWFLGWSNEESPRPDGPGEGIDTGSRNPAGETSLYHLRPRHTSSAPNFERWAA